MTSLKRNYISAICKRWFLHLRWKFYYAGNQWSVFQLFNFTLWIFFVSLSRVSMLIKLLYNDYYNYYIIYNHIIIRFLIGWDSATQSKTRGRNIQKSRTRFWTICKNGRMTEVFPIFPKNNWRYLRTVVTST